MGYGMFTSLRGRRRSRSGLRLVGLRALGLRALLRLLRREILLLLGDDGLHGGEGLHLEALLHRFLATALLTEILALAVEDLELDAAVLLEGVLAVAGVDRAVATVALRDHAVLLDALLRHGR